MVIGNPWKEKVAQFYKTGERSFKKNRNDILFSLQPAQGLHDQPIPDWIVEFLNDKASDNYCVHFRIHPSYQSLKKYVERRLIDIDNSKYVLDDAKYPIELIFKNMKFHITAFSTTCLISSDLGIPTAVFGVDALNYYRRDIKEKNCIGAMEVQCLSLTS